MNEDLDDSHRRYAAVQVPPLLESLPDLPSLEQAVQPTRW